MRAVQIVQSLEHLSGKVIWSSNPDCRLLTFTCIHLFISFHLMKAVLCADLAARKLESALHTLAAVGAFNNNVHTLESAQSFLQALTPAARYFPGGFLCHLLLFILLESALISACR